MNIKMNNKSSSSGGG